MTKEKLISQVNRYGWDHIQNIFRQSLETSVATDILLLVSNDDGMFLIERIDHKKKNGTYKDGTLLFRIQGYKQPLARSVRKGLFQNREEAIQYYTTLFKKSDLPEFLINQFAASLEKKKIA